LGSVILNTPPIEFKIEDIDMVLKPLFTGLFSLALILSLLSYILVIIFFKIKAYIRLNRKNKKNI
jgi:TctA family transporter